jgi:hypothetical protein
MGHGNTIIHITIKIIFRMVFKWSVSNRYSHLLAHNYSPLIGIWHSEREDGRFSSQSLPQDIGQTSPNSEMSQWEYAL